MRKILIVAYACEPFKGSEQGVGWNFSIELARKNKVCVITRLNNKSVIELNIPEEVRNNISFYYYDTPSLFLRLKNGAKGLYTYYTFWQLGIWGLVKKLHKRERFDYVFQPTMGTIWLPTFLSFMNIPFIWGPLGGGEAVPKSFIKTLPWKQQVVQRLRYILKYIIFINPLLISSLVRSKIILVRTENTMSYVPSIFRRKCRLILETAIENDIYKYKAAHVRSKQLKIVMTGRLIPFKNVKSVIQAIQLLPEGIDFHLFIIGKGSERKNIERAIEIGRIQDRVTLIKELPRQQVLEMLATSHIYLFPSLREGGSWALMEAMAIGLPVVCLNWTGNAIITDNSSAIRLDVTDPERFCRDMADAICLLASNNTLREEMGEMARTRIKEKFNWAEKGRFMEQVFQELDRNKRN